MLTCIVSDQSLMSFGVKTCPSNVSIDILFVHPIISIGIMRVHLFTYTFQTNKRYSKKADHYRKTQRHRGMSVWMGQRKD